jgi:hypothetical protein
MLEESLCSTQTDLKSENEAYNDLYCELSPAKNKIVLLSDELETKQNKLDEKLRALCKLDDIVQVLRGEKEAPRMMSQSKSIYKSRPCLQS